MCNNKWMVTGSEVVQLMYRVVELRIPNQSVYT